MIQAEGLAKEFRDRKSIKTAVEDVSFTANPGEVFGLLGVNGAGKTTTLRMLSTVIKPSRGSATIDGLNVVKNSREVRQRIGFMSASTALYGRLTPLEVLNYFGQLYDMPTVKLQERIEFVVERLALNEFLNRPCDKLSTGQKQRVSIARTILHDPPILFFDEPTAGLDVVNTQTVMEFIEQMREMGRTVIFSTHIMTEVERLCDRFAIIHDGRIRGLGTIQSFREETGQATMEAAFLTMVGYQRGSMSND